MDKYLCLDLGTTTLGIAKSDVLGIAHPYEEFKFDNGNYKIAREHVVELSNTLGINKIVIGYPLQIDRKEGERCESVKRFAKDLKELKSELEIEFFDESYSTIEANERLVESGFKKDKIKEVIDMYSAVVILEDYLRNNQNGKENKETK